MQDILKNLATLQLLDYCKRAGIPPNGYQGEGTYTVKAGRGVNGKLFYSLVSYASGRAIVTVTLSKNHIPTFNVHDWGHSNQGRGLS